MILSVTLNPSVDHALFVDQLRVGDTNRVKRTERDAGGKGINLSRVVAELGAHTVATGFLGGGPGDYVRGVLGRQGVSHDFVEVAEDTRINFSVEDLSLGPPTTFNEPGPHIRHEELENLFAKVRGHIGEVRWMTLGGSLPPGVPADIFAQFIRLANEHRVRVALDTDGEPLKLGIEAGPVFLKPNAKECGRLLNRSIETPEQALEGAIELNARLPRTCIVIVSLGRDGAVMTCDQGYFRGYTPQVEVRSTIGSGDSLIGGFLWALEEGKPVEEALRWGLACGAATATTDGSEIARKPKVLELLPQARVERLGPR
ncbi:MAG TPA: 1-phosphofructokinase [Fimbriimonadaceae bacterium]|nr:1-phosphofructokinase [Fimbriimonadaceae bacterium]